MRGRVTVRCPEHDADMQSFHGVGRHGVVIIDRGGTSWWVPLLIALGAAIVAGGASYLATWWFKRVDFNKETALRAADFVDEAERAISGSSRNPGPPTSNQANDWLRLLQMARVRCQPLGDGDLDDRLMAALAYAYDFQDWGTHPGGRRWMSEAVANVRECLNVHLAAPPLLPSTRSASKSKTRSFPTSKELESLQRRNRGAQFMIALQEWKDALDA